MIIFSALIYTFLTALVMLFQLGLAIGLPWGAASMGGKFPGKYPPKMRFVALCNIIVLSLLACIILIRAGIILPQLMPIAQVSIWLVVGFSVTGTILNTITPSKIERVWAPVSAILCITSVVIALS